VLGVAGFKGVDEMSEELSDDMHLFMALWLCKREEEIKGMVLEELRRTYLGLADDDEECKELHSGAQFTCFTGTEVQILTHGAPLSAHTARRQ
jgi:hypothetical protein